MTLDQLLTKTPAVMDFTDRIGIIYGNIGEFREGDRMIINAFLAQITLPSEQFNSMHTRKHMRTLGIYSVLDIDQNGPHYPIHAHIRYHLTPITPFREHDLLRRILLGDDTTIREHTRGLPYLESDITGYIEGSRTARL